MLNGKVVSTTLLSRDTYDAMTRIILKGVEAEATLNGNEQVDTETTREKVVEPQIETNATIEETKKEDPEQNTQQEEQRENEENQNTTENAEGEEKQE